MTLHFAGQGEGVRREETVEGVEVDRELWGAHVLGPVSWRPTAVK